MFALITFSIPSAKIYGIDGKLYIRSDANTELKNKLPKIGNSEHERKSGILLGDPEDVSLGFKYPRHVRFRCLRCASCCGDTESKVRKILLLRIEAERISENTWMAVDEFVDKIKGFEPYVYAMKKTEDGICIFLRDKLCSIYEIRPQICRFYPFQLQNLRGNRYFFTYTDECPGIGKGSYLKKVYFERMFDGIMQSIRENEKINL